MAVVTALALHAGWLYAGTLVAGRHRHRTEGPADGARQPRSGRQNPGGRTGPGRRPPDGAAGSGTADRAARGSPAGQPTPTRPCALPPPAHRPPPPSPRPRSPRCSAARPGRSRPVMPSISGRNFSALRLTPPPMMNSSGENSISTCARYFWTRCAQCVPAQVLVLLGLGRGVLLRLVAVQLQVAELGVGDQAAVDEQRAADARTEGQQDHRALAAAARAEASSRPRPPRPRR